ncbi:hypothetical protein KW783_00690 [Candidatus Parcubacteria bacterium]|nr:hypothetical protein [Candidatus Parcubacteria bacterium]
MLRLTVPNPEQADANIPIRWCVSKETYEILKAKLVKNPILYITVLKDREVVDRILTPVSAMMTYVQFHRKGKHTVRATIVWTGGSVDDDFFKRDLLKRSNQHDYEFDLFNFDKKECTAELRQGRDYSARAYLGCICENSEIDINVAEEFFAKEAPAWEKRWVNLWYEYAPRDQCQYRKRRFVAYSIQPPLVLLWVTLVALIRAIWATVLFLIGMRGVKFSPIIHPFGNSTSDVNDDVENNFFIENKIQKPRPLWFALLQPLSLVIVALVLFMHRPGAHMKKFELFIFAVPSILYLVFVSLVICHLILRRTESLEYKAAHAAEIEQRNKRQAERATQVFDETFHDLVCTGTAMPASLEALPKSRQTIRLRYNNFKAKVCKPFARS